ncbi:MAG: DEAD/DEAH box helicase [Methylobacteriaceae bacterium]|jgi:superfamily II DNA or RNA helicase|nr:DEAD/DEAH box helicase [Methylobacteriaceae bacterium]
MLNANCGGTLMTRKIWHYCTTHDSPCRVIDKQTLWGRTVYRVWLLNGGMVVNVPRSALRLLETDVDPEREARRIAYTTAAAAVAGVLEGVGGDILLAPMEANVIPLPHQIRALSRVVSGGRMRCLLADEVGLGKTIEAGLVLRELKLRGLVRRTLVVAPKGLATQWVAEMHTRFNEQFRLILGDDIDALQRLAGGAGERGSAWARFDQVIVSLDSVKPVDRRRGWSAERLADYNRGRFEDLVTAGWDLVIVDEAHRLGGSTDQVARYRLGRALAGAAPYMLLLSATPHQGKSDAFHRLMNLLDSEAFPDAESVSRERVAPYVIRTEKRRAVDGDGKPLFKPRRTQLLPVAWESRHHLQRLLYETVTDYVRDGYNRALREQRHHIGFLMILMQRLVVSSTRAIRTTLERRLAVLEDGRGPGGPENDEAEAIDELRDMDGQELLDELVNTRPAAEHAEITHVKTLLEAARSCEQAGPDAKAEALMQWIYELQAEENDPDMKLLIFTEFVPTQQMLGEFLEARGISVVMLNGSMDMEERRSAQEAFRTSHRVLVSTDAGGEGLNLQFAHVVINYDVPWNPMRLEQRIGRVDRIGQTRTVRALNFILGGSVEFRVLEVLEQKLSVILEEFGVDKTGDVLDSARAGELFEDVYATAILDPGGIDASVNRTVERLSDEIRQQRESMVLSGVSDEPDVEAAGRLSAHPLPHWVERMTVNYIRARGGSAERKLRGWDLTWPGGEVQRRCVFSSAEAEGLPDATLLTLENSRIRGLALNLEQMAPGEPVARVSVSGLPDGVSGLWGLFEIRLQAAFARETEALRLPMIRRGYIGVFAADDGKLFLPTARHIRDTLQTTDVAVSGVLTPGESAAAFDSLLQAAEQAGQNLFNTLQQAHRGILAREEERGTVSFAARRRAIDHVGLPEVRRFRLARCTAEEADWRRALQAAREVVPEIRPLLMLRIGGEGE